MIYVNFRRKKKKKSYKYYGEHKKYEKYEYDDDDDEDCDREVMCECSDEEDAISDEEGDEENDLNTEFREKVINNVESML